jgi:uracil-DNA glycosylase
LEKSYKKLVEKRKQCKLCAGYGMVNSSSIPKLDCNEIGLWSEWQGNIKAEVMVVGQDWGTQNFFLKNEGKPEDNSPTNKHLIILMKELGIQINAPSAEKDSGATFFTNAVLCLKEGNDSTKIRNGCLKICSETFLGPLMQIIKPKTIIALGRVAYLGCLIADEKSTKTPDGFLNLVKKHHYDVLSYGGKLFPVVHCSPVVCNLTRSLKEQIQDWQHIATLTRGNLINHLNVMDEKSRVYCKKENKVIALGNHWEICTQCEFLRGSVQGEGVECEWYDEEVDSGEFVLWVRNPSEEYRRLNKAR